MSGRVRRITRRLLNFRREMPPPRALVVAVAVAIAKSKSSVNRPHIPVPKSQIDYGGPSMYYTCTSSASIFGGTVSTITS